MFLHNSVQIALNTLPVLFTADKGRAERPGRVERALVGHEGDGVGRPDHDGVHAQRAGHHGRRLGRRRQDGAAVKPETKGEIMLILTIIIYDGV